MKRVFLFGANGQLGQEIVEVAGQASEVKLTAFTRDELDITHSDAVTEVFIRDQPDVVINAAAYTAVDQAESEKNTAFLINAEGPKILAMAAKAIACRFITVSTDYVFGDLENQVALPVLLDEDTETVPVNVYGASKLEGEKTVLAIYPEGSLVLRTSSVHGAYGANFVKTMLRLIEERDELKVVQDQIMSPTWTGWLAKVLLELCEVEQTGLLHASNSGAVSWYEFAVCIRELASFPDSVTPAKIMPISASEYPTAARRPSFSALNCSRLEKLLGQESEDWVQGLRGHLAALGRLKEEQNEINLKEVVYE